MGFLAGAFPLADGDPVVGVCSQGGLILGKSAYSSVQPRNGLRQVAQRPAGDVSLVGVVLAQHSEPLQLSVGLGQGQDCGVAGGDRLHLGIGEFLATDVLGLADGGLAGHHLGDESCLVFQGLPLSQTLAFQYPQKLADQIRGSD
jgi:hypothetical protein